VTSTVVYERADPPARILCDEFDSTRAVLWLSGEIDCECADALAAELAHQRAQRRRIVRIDTYGVTFLDTTALDVLVTAHRQWLAMRGTLVLIGVTGSTARLLSLTGLDRELLVMPPAADMELATQGLVSTG
jgi:anti-anti-sigma factor